MGTKSKPGNYDCYVNAEPDEPMFVLLARDDRAPALVEAWADASEKRGTTPAKVEEARACAAAMRAWRTEHRPVIIFLEERVRELRQQHEAESETAPAALEELREAEHALSVARRAAPGAT